MSIVEKGAGSISTRFPAKGTGLNRLSQHHFGILLAKKSRHWP